MKVFQSRPTTLLLQREHQKEDLTELFHSTGSYKESSAGNLHLNSNVPAAGFKNKQEGLYVQIKVS